MGRDTKRKIAIITTNMDVEYASEIQYGVIQESRTHHFDVYIFNAFVSSDELVKHNIGEYNIYTLANLSEFDGVIVFSNLLQGRKIYHTVESRLEEIDIPVVGIDAPMGDHYWVGVENYQAMKAIVEHFIEHHKFTKINYISGQSFNTDSQSRLKAYCDAMTEHGLPVEEKRIFPGAFTNQHGRDAAMQMLSSGEELPQAVVCGNDGIALGFSNVLREHGIKIPEQVAVSGFDNTFEAKNSVPRLTTVDRSLVTVGMEAVKKIKAHLDGENPAKNEVFPAVPILEGTCGCDDTNSDDIDGVRQRYLHLVDHYERHLIENNDMIEDLNDSKSFDDFLDRLKPYVKALECDCFYFCLDKELVDDLKQLNSTDTNRKMKKKQRTEGYAPVMSVALAYEFGRFEDYKDFPSEQMLPWEAERTPGGDHTYVFAPVHFREVCQGYLIIENSEYVLTSPLFRAWLINLSSGLENLRKQANLKYMFERLDRLYVMDYLTELYNRFGFSRYTAESFKRCADERKQLMILFADMDGLKKINDMYGHDKGDIAIKAVADSLKNACEGDEICARFGGDEYVVYAADYDEEKAEAFCKRFEEELANYNRMLKQPFDICASYGYELFIPAQGELIDKYIDRADERMYTKKKNKYAERR